MRYPKWLIGGALATAVTAVLVLSYLYSIQLFASAPVYQTRNGALDGYDPVAYFTEGRAQRGRAELSLDWNGAVWHFASPAHREAFRREPARYAPQFGGYCAYAVGKGYTAKTAPEAWHIVDSKLYLNFDLNTRDKWLAAAAQLIAQGNRNWPRVIQD